MRLIKCGARHAAVEDVSLGQQRAFGRDIGDVAREHRMTAHEVDDHRARQAFGQRQFVDDRFAFDQDVHDLRGRGARGDRVLAGLERCGFAIDHHADAEDECRRERRLRVRECAAA